MATKLEDLDEISQIYDERKKKIFEKLLAEE
jgi:hypothetical protein